MRNAELKKNIEEIIDHLDNLEEVQIIVTNVEELHATEADRLLMRSKVICSTVWDAEPSLMQELDNIWIQYDENSDMFSDSAVSVSLFFGKNSLINILKEVLIEIHADDWLAHEKGQISITRSLLNLLENISFDDPLYYPYTIPDAEIFIKRSEKLIVNIFGNDSIHQKHILESRRITQLAENDFEISYSKSHLKNAIESALLALEVGDFRSRFEELTKVIETSQNGAIEVKPRFGTPSEDEQFKCDIFMLLPFRDAYQEIYENCIVPIAKDLEKNIKKGDYPFSNETIMSDIWSMLYSSTLVIADCSEDNANVFYELGMAHTLGKSTIVITSPRTEDKMPFDISAFRYIEYKSTPNGKVKLGHDLRQAIRKLLKWE